ncbi:DUF305 domain-containing protein [Clostridium tertium]|jgi:uncharacterized protein (DUF305 family)|uniref:DUF305 domain-containing protein n=1 Tax=Clostridium TaxID=1485 RepID=UPI001159E01C|nr:MULTISPECIES: DUF305 domain-containing protein [Clostridium]MBS5307206.1 DUF305 domain-containing protein [Clostridium sp.]MDB1924114.1 DUF305 domain-containing protein [Clostridium tertium]MDB1927313.1 DUF305 domain-containing protein [Clostridium tertium]MDB1931089.1 DUF305 domain-containing protein [Clostridium tertium]MDB1934168.1 DUF305 domain-containing protein [Clostridium tertium]
MKTLLLSLLISTSIANINFISPLQNVSANINNSTISNEKQGYNEEYTTIFNNMMKAMNAAPNTGNVNLDFVLEMIPHHEGGINMAKAIVKYGSNPEVKKIAENIITSQESQIPIMQQLKAKFEKEKPSSKADSEKYLEEYNKVKDKMFKEMQGVEITNNVDANFLQEMIYHHEGAIGMAKDILKYTKDPELRKLAENIVTTQSKGVEEMTALLKKF